MTKKKSRKYKNTDPEIATLNALIAFYSDKVKEAVFLFNRYHRDIMERPFHESPVSYDEGGRNDLNSSIPEQDLKSAEYWIGEIRSNQNVCNQLSRLKLRLYGDYDFSDEGWFAALIEKARVAGTIPDTAEDKVEA